ncbi:MAG: ATP-dependent DNA helicase [Arcanobacterium sp.]|nr:ATP-dependent DNA helicase [Arcanobacterium sp.]
MREESVEAVLGAGNLGLESEDANLEAEVQNKKQESGKAEEIEPKNAELSAAAPDEISEVFSQVISELGGSYRAGQAEMVRQVWDALNNDGHLMVQAGTGTGKSLGYLVPAIYAALVNGKRTVISTATIALQRQIMVKDAPAVTKALQAQTGKTARIALLKGWNNYVCQRKVDGGYPEEGALLSRAEGTIGATARGAEVVRAREWASTTDTGDRDDLNPGVSEFAWNQISVSKRECLGESCSFRDTCFPMLARKNAQEADVVVTNHSILGVAATGNPILPDVDAYIVDEAHDLADRVTEQLSAVLSKFDLSAVARMMRSAGLSDSELSELIDEFQSTLEEIGEGRLAVLPDHLIDFFLRLQGAIQDAFLQLQDFKTKDETLLATKQVLRARLTEITEIADLVLGDRITSGRVVAWISQGNDDVARFCTAPLDVSGVLGSELFAERATILTSATLQVGGSFNAVAARVGFLRSEVTQWEGVDVGSPFNPQRQGFLYCPDDLAAPSVQGYGDETLERIVELIDAAEGGALCLFTSRGAVERAAEYLREHTDFKFLVQGEGNLPELIEEFRDDPYACLLGTASLWQGVDVPGLTNRLVIIDRIPFPRPNDPLVQARTEAARLQGRNSFLEVSANYAALMLAQGAGRLLRSMEDLGVVAILDSRLITKQYGGYLRASLPKFWETSDKELVLKNLRNLVKRL